MLHRTSLHKAADLLELIDEEHLQVLGAAWQSGASEDTHCGAFAAPCLRAGRPSASSARSIGGQLRWCLNKVKDSEGWWRAVRKQQSSKIYQHLSKFQMWLFWVLFLETRERPLTRYKTSRPPRYLIFGASQSVACQHDVGRCWHPQPIAICTECCPNFKSWVALESPCVQPEVVWIARKTNQPYMRHIYMLILMLFDLLHVPELCAKEQEKLLESRHFLSLPPQKFSHLG